MENKFILAVFLILVVFTLTGTVSAADRDVGPGKTYATINEAIIDAETGDNINVYDNDGVPLTYEENVKINKGNLAISSKGDVTVTPLDDNYPAFTVFEGGAGSSIKNFKLQGTEDEYDVGIWIGSSKITVEKNEIFHFNTAISVQASSETKILKNKIYENTKDSYSGSSIIDNGGIYTEISGNTIENNYKTGIEGCFSQYLKIIGNNLSNNQDGIEQWGCCYSTIYGNILDYNTNTGINLYRSSFCKLSGNTIKHSPTGILIQETFPGFEGNNEIISSSITDCGIGIDIKGTNYAKVISSSIASNTIGIKIRGFFESLSTLTWIPAETNEIFLNVIHNNQNGILIDDSPNNGIYNNNIYNNVNGITVSSLFATSDNNNVNFNRIAYNSGYGLVNYASSIVDATCNWWGSNKNPSNKVSANYIDYNPWIVLKIREGPTSAPNNWRKIVADFTYTSAGWQVDFSKQGASGFPNILVTFGTDQGTIETPKYTNNVAIASSILTIPTSFSGTIYTWIMVDDEFLYLPITVALQQPPQYIGTPFLFNSIFFKIAHTVAIHVDTKRNNYPNQSSDNSRRTSGSTSTLILVFIAIIIIGGGSYWLFARR